MENDSLKVLEDKTKNLNYLHNFYKGERNRIITKQNFNLCKKMKAIEKRENVESFLILIF